MERRIDYAMVSLLGIITACSAVWAFDRWAGIKEMEIHTRAGHSLVVYPSGYESVWSVKDRGLMEFLEQQQEEEDSKDAPKQ
jgi:hypothetical protein